MTLTRRHLLQMAVSVPLVSAATWSSQTPLMSVPCNCISILLHGFFFLEYQDNILVAAAPNTSSHRYFVRDHGGTPVELKGIIEMSALKARNPVAFDFFPAQMLRFSKDAVGIEDNLIDMSMPNNYSWILKLPIPNDIVPLRKGPFTDFHPDPPTGKVASSIITLHKNECDVSVITWLKYEFDVSVGFVTRSFYAEHDHRASPTEVNSALRETQRRVSRFFDLQIENKKVDAYLCDNNLPTEITQDDEKSLMALLRQQPCYTPLPKEAVEVATCPQFGVMS